ncbi:MAG: DUF1573 domain-containing protein [Chitinophagaceae bacterium]|nr:DUF1573 domain-containing protein [Chitinophagaceae bacterium]
MTKNPFLLLAVLSIVFIACQSPENKPAENLNHVIAPANDQEPVTTIQWIDSTFDKGIITEGEKIEIVYRFKNTGDKPLVIKDVRPSCGCTVAEKPLEPIAPGKEGSIKAVFDSQNKPGPAHKTITVISNTRPENYALTFNVTVNKKS